MAVFSVNLFRQLYVAKAWKGEYNKTNVVNVGDLAYKITADKHLYFVTKTKGGLLRSDLIDLSKVYDARVSAAADEKYALKEVEIKFATGVTPVKNQEYGINIHFKALISQGEEDTYDVPANAIATSTTASDVYKELAKSLFLNMYNMETEFVDVFLKTSGSEVKLDLAKAKEYNGNALNGTYTGVIIREADRSGSYIRGIYDVKPLNFTVTAYPTVAADGTETLWANNPANGETIAPVDSTTKIGNGMKIADLEYFCMGERGDIYRKINWPFYIPTDYLVDPSAEYDTLNVHFYWSGEGVQDEHSDRDMTIVAPTGSIISSIAQVLANAGVCVLQKSGNKVAPIAAAAGASLDEGE